MPSSARSQPLTGGRLAAVVGGAATLLLASVLLLAGTGLLWADSRKDEDGYFSTSHERVETSTYAIATDDLEIDGDSIGDDLYGRLRLQVSGERPVFAGVARTSDVDAYLRQSAHATLTDVEFGPFEPRYRDSAGSTAPGRPGARSFWAASTEGSGERTLSWDVKDGSWSVVVMNADGSPGVDARVSAGASVPFLDELGWAVSIASVLLGILGALLVTVGVRRGKMHAG